MKIYSKKSSRLKKVQRVIKFPSINQYRQVVKHVQTQSQYVGKDENGDAIYDKSLPFPVLKFRGTVKLHGTNGGITYNWKTGETTYQSRERELSLTSDNAGFMLHMMQHRLEYDVSLQVLELLDIEIPGDSVDSITIFGEWCGGSIQKGVALNGLEKMFVVFAVKIVYDDETSEWVPVDKLHIHSPERRIFNIATFPKWELDIDFARPEIAQNKMIEITEAVEAECPVGAYFGIPNGVGEGVVWTCISPGYENSGTWFKVKGEKHSVSRVKTLSTVDVEAVQAVHDFVENTVTGPRLEWALDNMLVEKQLPFEMKSMGDFIRIVYNDVLKEEMDIIVELQLDPKKLGSPIANKARPWYMKRYNGS